MAHPNSPSPKLYRRLPGSGALSFQRSRLWIAPDHLLLVASSVMGERYKRFYFADIHAFVVRKTSYWWGAAAWTACAILFGALAVAVDDPPAVRTIFLVITGLFVGLLIWHFARGETCSFQIRTAVQTEQIPSLSRIRVARRVIAQLRPLIEAAQTIAPAAEPNPEA